MGMGLACLRDTKKGHGARAEWWGAKYEVRLMPPTFDIFQDHTQKKTVWLPLDMRAWMRDMDEANFFKTHTLLMVQTESFFIYKNQVPSKLTSG